MIMSNVKGVAHSDADESEENYHQHSSSSELLRVIVQLIVWVSWPITTVFSVNLVSSRNGQLVSAKKLKFVLHAQHQTHKIRD